MLSYFSSCHSWKLFHWILLLSQQLYDTHVILVTHLFCMRVILHIKLDMYHTGWDKIRIWACHTVFCTLLRVLFIFRHYVCFRSDKTEHARFLPFLSYFFVKKYLLVGTSGMLWTGQWVSEWVRDVCMSHQSDWIYYEQPIKFLVVKVNDSW